ncbi:MAG: multiheme c-type cytochrome [Melioribacteraceae bacterium]|nr:multiheme c-type cytochrome [Melioribacteraceae bacterium]
MLRVAIPLVILFSISILPQTKIQISDDTQTCIDCHDMVTPGIVRDWESSRHASTNLSSALEKDQLSRRISIDAIPDELDGSIVIGCFECHSLNTEAHQDSFDHFGYSINVIVTPDDCKTCHPVEVEEYVSSKKGFAYANLADNSVYHTLVETVTSSKRIENSKVVQDESSELTKGETCNACHGTVVEVDGTKLVNTALGEIEVPNLTNWPNQGVGRINPDGSKGACTACHPRHSFSIEIARQPYTCGQCHLEPDVPAFNVYKESKHGNIYQSMKSKFNWEEVPWEIGKDFKTPTCASCHNSLIVDAQGSVIAERSHDFGSRLWVRIFGLIYSHPQPKFGDTYRIKNADGLPLPTTFSNQTADEYLIGEEEQLSRKAVMQSICVGCHGTSWSEQQLAKIDNVNEEVNQMVLAATELMQTAWDEGLEDPTNPFDEQIEILWQRQWLFYANSVRYGTAMMGPDYSTFKNGWWELTQTLQKMHDLIQTKSLK